MSRFFDVNPQEIMSASRMFLQASVLSTEQEYRQLVYVLHYHEWRYYVKDEPLLADVEYDQLFNLLQQFETEHPDWITSDSPTQRIGSDLSSDVEAVKHISPMLSLPNSYNAEDLHDFHQQMVKRLGEEAQIEYVVEPKFDGGTVVVVYEDDQLARGATRGNGVEGDDITANIRVMRTVPLSAGFSEHGLNQVELRGEAIIRKDRFKKMNEDKAAMGDELYANPRNTATGGLRTKDPNETLRRQIEVFVYQIASAQGLSGTLISKHDETVKLLDELGFKTAWYDTRTCSDIDEVIRVCEDWEQRRDAYPYEIDGLVIKVNDLNQQDELGTTNHHPRWAMAYKFKAKQATTILKQVVFQVGKIGTITPVAKVEPVSLAGVTVSSISLHNADFIKQKNLWLHDQILIERAGDVIPYVVKSFPELRDQSQEPVVFPNLCPINDTEYEVALVRDGSEAAYRCPKCVCGQQDLQRMIFFVSKDAMNIDGLGAAMVELFHEKGWIKNPADLYALPYDEIRILEGFGERSVENLEQAINKTKSNPIHRLLYALGIHHLGQRASKIFTSQIDHLLELRDWTEEDMTLLKDIGPVVARNLKEWFDDTDHVHMLERMELLGVNLTYTEEDRPAKVSEGPLMGKTILFTGTLIQMTRKEAQKRAESMGAKNISAVSGNLDILVVGAKAGSKLKKAQALGSVQILTEEDFLALT